MPTYDYKCLTCDKVFEYFQAMKDEQLKECLCEKKGKVSRMISGGSGIIFKGSGFYVNDYKKAATNESTPTSTASPSTTAPAPAVTSTPSTTTTSSSDKK